jgi:hypothetical protein
VQVPGRNLGHKDRLTVRADDGLDVPARSTVFPRSARR